MLIDSRGLLQGERIGACSDEAQLHFARLMAASNGLGRIEMSYGNIIRTVYAQFAKKPTKEELTGWFSEYHQHLLLLPYRAENGSIWGQWDVPPKMYPRYKTAADLQSPAPPQAELNAFLRAKAEARRNNYVSPEEDFIHLPVSQHFGNTSQISEITSTFSNHPEKDENFSHGIGIGTGIGEKQRHENSAEIIAGTSPPKPVPNPEHDYELSAQPRQDPVRSQPLTESDVELIRMAYPLRKAPVPARKAIRVQHALLIRGCVTTAAGIKLPKMTSAEATAYLLERTRLYADSPKGRSKQFIPYPATWFNGGAYTEDESMWNLCGTLPVRHIPPTKFSDPEAMNVR